VRLAAASALAELRDAASVPPLAAALSDTVPSVRRAVARALASIGTDTALDALGRVVPGDDAQLRGILDRALSRRRYRI
jgi:HEAT repeat protein